MTKQKITDEFICEKVDQYIGELSFELQREKAFVSKFNERIRVLVPELKDCKKSFYSIYNKYQPQ